MPEKPAPPPKMSEVPDPNGMFGEFGGSFVPEALVPALEQLASTYLNAMRDDRFWDELRDLQRTFTGRPTALYHAKRLTNVALKRSKSGEAAKIWLKREDLCLTGSSAICNAMGQAMLARAMGKTRLIADSGSGRHGVAVATAAAHFGLACEGYCASAAMKAAPAMAALGARVVDTGNESRTGAITEALRDWVASHETTHYAPGLAIGPHPLPTIVRDFQSVIGTETKAQSLRLLTKLPDVLVAAVDGASVGFFYPFVDDDKVQLVGVEAGGRGSKAGEHAAALTHGQPGVLHGSQTCVLQDENGQSLPTHTVAGGMNYAGSGPEHAYWKDKKRVRYATISDALATEACEGLARTEGILASLESSHAIAEAVDVASRLKGDQNVVVCISRGAGV
jgi:tryptophan synthase beta chain